MASLSTPETVYYDIPPGYMVVREDPPRGLILAIKYKL